MKNTTFITTFSYAGYEQHGKRWIDSFIRNTSNVNAIIFVDFDLSISDTRIKVLNFSDFIPEHKHWVYEFSSLHKDEKEKNLGIVFSHKSFVMLYALNNLSEYVIWLDSDCVFKENTFDDFAEKVLDNKFIAVQVDKVMKNDWWKTEDHVETGIVIFDMDHSDKNKFLNKFKELYNPKNMAEMIKPYDGFVIMRTCREIDYVDLLPANYTIMGTVSELTFIHAEVKPRFIHNIGSKGY